MKATELLIKQHRLVEELFERFEEAEGDEQKDIFEQLAANLVAHDAIERELFYPACEEALGEEDDILGESLVEHGVVEFSIFRADKNQGSEDFDKYVTVLKEMVEHHVKEEEKELLPKVKREIEDEQLEELGAAMEKRFEAAMRSDFRKPLQSNLQQVLDGKTRTSKKPAARSANGVKAKPAGRSAPRVARRRRSGSKTSTRKQPRRKR
ncbi:MAG TPA: hemerythrin domain-containing protein [Polyangiaceae bacterium]